MSLESNLEAAKATAIQNVIESHRGLDLKRIFDPRAEGLSKVEQFVKRHCKIDKRTHLPSDAWLAEFTDAMQEAFKFGEEVGRTEK